MAGSTRNIRLTHRQGDQVGVLTEELNKVIDDLETLRAAMTAPPAAAELTAAKIADQSGKDYDGSSVA